MLYGRFDHVCSDVRLTVADDAEIAPFEGDAPVAGSRADVRAWLADRDEQSERFEVNCFEDPDRSLDAYLRLLATNDPWRLEGHGSLGRRLSDLSLLADLTTFDRRITYLFDASQFFDYLRLDLVRSVDPSQPQTSVRIESLIDVSALRDDRLRQIVSSYEIIFAELRLTERFSGSPAIDAAFTVQIEPNRWERYLADRKADPARFLPPVGWTSAFPTY